MTTKIKGYGQDFWLLLTEVPGWPDAPRRVRIRRALPILIPCVAMVLLVIWNAAVRDPHVRRERMMNLALLAQDKEIEALRLSCSQQEAEDLAAKSAQVAHLILNQPEDLASILQGLKKEATDQNWEATFQPSDLSTGAAASDTQLTFLPARGKLTTMGKPEAFPALLTLLEQFSAFQKRIDLTRMSIRADEQGRYTAELNLRLVCRTPNEKTPQ